MRSAKRISSAPSRRRSPSSTIFNCSTSLSPRDKRAGYVEAVKVALIRDAEFFDALERDADGAARISSRRRCSALIHRCAELHLDHIATSGDPFEFGSARPLDFGHWSAHKLEQLSEYRMRHGEAVAIGIALDVDLLAAHGLSGRGVGGARVAIAGGAGLRIVRQRIAARRIRRIH